MSVTLHTDLGTLKLEIYCDIVPRTSFNFLALAASGYYDGTLFHRNVKGFMVQGGDPTGTGKGGESIWGGKFNDELRSENTHSARGIVSMANSGPGTNGSQFFITYAKHPHLDNNYTVFGKTIDGWDALAAIDGWAWPGNVRELENRVKRAVIMADGKLVKADDLDLGDADEEDAQVLNLKSAREKSDRKMIRHALARSEGNISSTAKMLGISRPTLYDLIKQYDLQT